MNNKEIRWKQRFENFEKAFLVLSRAVNQDEYSELERGGLIQYYEVSFELSWKTMKDFLESKGFDVKSPRDTIKRAFQTELIEEGHEWISALENRNITSHAYDENKILEIINLIKKNYYPLIDALYRKLKQEL